MLKLRYFWKLVHSDDYSIAHRVFQHRREQFFLTKNGFIHEAGFLKTPPSVWVGAVGGWGLAPIFSPLGEKVRRWGKMCLEKGVFGGWGADAGG